MRIAVIGSGISGNMAAWTLKQAKDETGSPLHDVVMYEKRDRPGGHSHTVNIDHTGMPLSVDVGFIVYNELNYPNLVQLFRHLDVETVQSDMSFGVSLANGGVEWSGHSLDAIFAQRKNALSPSFLMMLCDILRFNKRAPIDLKEGFLKGKTLGEYLEERRLGQAFRNRYLAPMGAAIWSTPHADIFDFPAENFIAFFNNHRLMHMDRPKWRTVKGGSQAYVGKITAPFQDQIRYQSEVVNVTRRNGQVHVKDISGHEDVFDHVIFASHTDQTLAMIGDANDREQATLSAIRYRPNKVYLHRDPALMPRLRKVWSSWNYIETSSALQEETGVCVSYSMNKLQNIDDAYPTFVSLNPAVPPKDELIFAETSFDHPQFNNAALIAQRDLKQIQGQGNYWYCGAWCGYGFHEDGLVSGLDVAEALGGRVPWRSYPDMSLPTLEAAE